MANDEQGGTELAKWSGFEISVPPPFLEPIITAINSFLEQIIVLLDIALFILDIIKVFIVGLVGPILALLDFLIELLEGLLNDLRKAGLYLRGDWTAFEGGYAQWSKELYGGYGKFESRVFQWMNDTNDRGRPDFSEKAAVLGLFFYVSVDFSAIKRAIKALMTLLRFLGQFFKGGVLPIPTSLRIQYPEITSKPTELITEGNAPTEALIEWSYAAPPGTDPTIPFGVPNPDAVIIEVSTVMGGVLLGYTDRFPNDTMKHGGGESKVKGFFKQDDSRGGGPYRSYSGIALIDTQTKNSQTCMAVDPNTDGGFGGFAILDLNAPDFISVKKWKDVERDNDLIGLGTAWICKGKSFRLRAEHLPHPLIEIKEGGEPVFADEPAQEVWVRVTPIEDYIADAHIDAESDCFNKKILFGSVSTEFPIGSRMTPKAAIQFRKFSDGIPKAICAGQSIDPSLGLTGYGTSSAPVKAYFPSAGVQDFMEMIRAAVVICVLTRPDLDKGLDDPTGLKVAANEIYEYLCPTLGPDRYFRGLMFRSYAFRNNLRSVADQIADAFLDRVMVVNCDPMLDRMVDQHYDNTAGLTGDNLKLLSGYKPYVGHKDISLLDMLKTSTGTFGIHKNPYVAYPTGSVPQSELDQWYKDAKLNTAANLDQGGGDFKFSKDRHKKYMNQVPVFLSTDTPDTPVFESAGNVSKWMGENKRHAMIPCRNAFSAEMLVSARTVLGIALNPNTSGKWVSFRPLEQILEPIDQYLEKVLDFLKAVRKGLAAIIEQILKYIRMIEARIMEIQALIRRIQAILAQLMDLKIDGDLKFLICSSAGTSGLVSDFMSAEDKPEDSSASYGLGGCVVMGGIPFILLDLIGAIIGPSDE